MFYKSESGENLISCKCYLFSFFQIISVYILYFISQYLQSTQKKNIQSVSFKLELMYLKHWIVFHVKNIFIRLLERGLTSSFLILFTLLLTSTILDPINILSYLLPININRTFLFYSLGTH